MKIFKRRRDAEQPNPLEQVEFLQNENDTLLDQVESLKLDVSELTAENQRLQDKLNRSKFQRTLVKTGSGLAVLFFSYILLLLCQQESADIIWLLLIEAVFIFLMLRGDEK